jgi:hypothetical protein
MASLEFVNVTAPGVRKAVLADHLYELRMNGTVEKIVTAPPKPGLQLDPNTVTLLVDIAKVSVPAWSLLL